MSSCYSCHQILNKKNRSFEHIIPNAIGGVMKSNRLICRECNQAYGMTIDAALAKDFEDLTAFINLERDRPKPLLIKNTVAPNEDLYHLGNERNPGSDPFMRSVAKIAVNYYLMKVRGRHNLDKIIDIINGEEANHGHIHYFPLPVTLWQEGEISHAIKIKGLAASKRLYAHTILFSTYSLVINMCDNYEGEDIELFYRYDVCSREEIKAAIDLHYNKSELLTKMRSQRNEWNKELLSSFTHNLGRILQIAAQRQSQLSLEGIIDKTLNKAISQYPTGTVITQEMLNEINAKVFAKINEYLPA